MKALILSAGYGTRLGKLTEDIPKPMLDINGSPLLEYTIKYLKSNGIREIAINLHFLPDMITSYFGDGAKWGISLTYAYEEKLLGTAGAVYNLRNFFKNEREFLVLYGDILIDEPIESMLKQHQETNAFATIMLHQRKGSNSLVKMESDRRISAFIERPDEQVRAANPFAWVNSGVQILNRKILDRIPANQASDLPRDIYCNVVKEERLFGYPLTGFRCAIDSPDRYNLAISATKNENYKLK